VFPGKMLGKVRLACIAGAGLFSSNRYKTLGP
jgi:hypothetical protein